MRQKHLFRISTRLDVKSFGDVYTTMSSIQLRWVQGRPLIQVRLAAMWVPGEPSNLATYLRGMLSSVHRLGL